MILFQNLFHRTSLECIGYTSGYLPKLNRALGLASEAQKSII